MSTSGTLSVQRVEEFVLANRVIRAPDYRKSHDEGVQFTDLDRGLQWGADVVPALQGLFRVERDPRDDRPDGWVGFARHWRGATLQVEFDEFSDPSGSDAVLVVTGVFGRAGTETITDKTVGEVALPEQVPTEGEWRDRRKRYEAARRSDDTDGATAVRAYVAALPGWKRDVATRFDEIVGQNVPDVRRAVRYHQPFYGVEGEGWFASFSAFSKHVKLSFVSDSYLEPRPPAGSGPERQALDVTETDTLDEERVGSWVRQAAAHPGMGW
ncbi:DUF1801 domain-containing protein [Halomarina salina]|uniref:DUF1801 domain-containing protein n=1 Tax=Halomarina salina TaxID=1872699 RepID=A0ABD5RGP9_9EURY|nr:DUF1801 domain-containing protein [Halomarina salina]